MAGNMVSEMKQKQQKEYEKNVAKVIQDIELIRDSADIQKIKGYSTDANKLKGFTKFYTELVKDKKYDKFNRKEDEATIKLVFDKLKASGLL